MSSSTVTYTSISSDSDLPPWGFHLMDPDEFEASQLCSNFDPLEEDPEEDLTDEGDDVDEEESFEDDDKEEEKASKEDEDEKEEYLALADSTVLPVTDPFPSAEETEPFETNKSAATPPPPKSPRIIESYITIHLPSTTCISPPLLLPAADRRSDIPETNMPYQKRLCLTTIASWFEVWESSTATATRQTGHTLARRVDYGFIDTLDASIRSSESRVMTTVEDAWSRSEDRSMALEALIRAHKACITTLEAQTKALQRDVSVLQRQRIEDRDRLTIHIQYEHDSSSITAVVAKVNSSPSTPAISSDVAELKDMVRALLLDKKNQSLTPAPSPIAAPVKAVESNCVTCGGTHSYQNCAATSGNVYQDNIQDGNVYQDNIQEYVSQAAIANYNQGNTDFRPQMVANQIRPPRFPPVQNNQNNFNQGNDFTQNREGNFNQSQLHRPQVNPPPAYQALAYQAPTPQTHSVSQNDFERYVKANDAVLRNIQSQGQSTQNQCQTMQNKFQTMQNQLAKLTDMMSKFMSSNMASFSGSGTLPVSEPVVAPVSAPMPNLKPSIPYPSRHDNERRREQANEQIKKFYKIFKDMSFEITFTDALILMPKFASTLKALIGNKEKLSDE
nr:reverse transcriptase domain-containing protein [Tanacetum cinerariifolium]